MTDDKFIVAIELGSSRAKIGIAGIDSDASGRTLRVYRIAELPTVDSIRYGRINNIKEVTDTVSRLVDKVDKQWPIDGRKILSVFAGIGGRSLKSHRISSRRVLSERCEITETMIEELQDAAIESLGGAGELVDVEPVRYTVDNIHTPRPVGALGSRLAGEFIAVTCSPSNRDDLYEVVNDRVGLRINGAIVRPTAIAHLVLTSKETSSGCMLVDFGAETVTVAIYRNYALQYLATIPIGSRLITRDLAASLALTEDEAERIKIERGDATLKSRDMENDDAVINRIVAARLADIVANIKAQVEFAKMDVKDLPGGIILVGGGSRMLNFDRLLESQTGLKVRMATLPPEVEIKHEEIKAADNFDIIALLSEAAEMVRDGDDPECVSAAPRRPRNVTTVVETPRQERPAAATPDSQIVFDMTARTRTEAANSTAFREETEVENPFGASGTEFGGQGASHRAHYGDDRGDDEVSLFDDDTAEARKKKSKRQEPTKQPKQPKESKPAAKKEKTKKENRLTDLSKRIDSFRQRMQSILVGDDDDDSVEMN